MANYQAPDTPPAVTVPMNSTNEVIVCMYIPNCDTNSQPRKAISHIFGRNKMCTRQIPQDVWVHYCRKHYQRSRYRNPKEYAKLQCDLVQQQIRRVHDWSEGNKEKGQPGVVIDWGLAVRKREQKRLEELNGASRKRNASTLDDNEGGDPGRTGSQPPNTAVPDWLLAKCGTGYDTNGILEVFNRLHNAILNDEMSAFPDIEILPNISVTLDDEQPETSSKGYAKRPASIGHKRSQSLGVGLKSDYYSADRRSSYSDAVSFAGSSYGSPTQKRRRANDMGENNSPVGPIQRSRFSERPLEAGPSSRRILQQFSHQNMYDIAENQPTGDRFYTNSPTAYYQVPLPAPTPQRLNGSMAATLESNQYTNGRRPVHNRSQSDMGSFSGGRVGYSPAPSSVYAPEVNGSYARSPFHDGSVRQYHATPQHQWEPAGAQAMHHNYSHQVRQAGHQRISSTPIIGSSQGPAMQSMHNSPSASYGPRIIESQQARDLYSSRR
jgi:hypothetical protein